MTDLFDRLFPMGNEANIPGHYFRASVGDYVSGNTTRQEIINYWSLDSEAQADLNVLLDAVDGIGGSAGKARFLLELHDVLMISEAGAKYTTKASFKTRMGL